MSGILNTKQRIMDFSLTREGYKQVQNGDLRIKYATLNDKNAIYDSLPESFNVADTNATPFLFENYDSDLDILNPEIDLNLSAFTSDLSNNLNLITDYNNSRIEIANGKLITSSSNVEELLQNLTLTTNLAIEKSSILLSDNYMNFDIQSQNNFDVSLQLNKINDNNVSDQNNFSLNTNTNKNILLNNLTSGSYYTFLENDLIINDNTMFDDSRFINKLPLLFLPPSNMNPSVVSRNNKILNMFNIAEDRRLQSKVIYKNLKNNNDISIIDIKDLKELSQGLEILNSISNLNTLSKSIIVYEKNDPITGNIISGSINNLNKILSFEMEFLESEENCPFLFQMYETNNTNNLFNRLLVVDHGEIYDSEIQKNKQIYSIGKLYHTKTDINIQEEFSSNKIIENKFIQKDNYQFVNLFTMILY